MSRIFLGNRGGGNGKTPGTPIVRSGIDKKTGKQVTLTPEQQYKKAFEDKMAGYQKEFNTGNKYAFQLPGTNGGQVEKKTMSKSAKSIIEKIAAIKTKRELKKKGDAIKVIPKSFGGMCPGRVDAKGNIYNSANQVIATINLKTGKISNKMGFSLGKYKPDDTYSDFRISRILQNEAATAQRVAAAKNPQAAAWNPMTGGVSPPASDNNSSGSGWGTPGNFWGGTTDDDKKGWW